MGLAATCLQLVCLTFDYEDYGPTSLSEPEDQEMDVLNVREGRRMLAQLLSV